MEFLNWQKLKYDWDNEELEYSEGIVVDAKPEQDAAANFPGIELESNDVGVTGISAIAEPSLEQEGKEAAENVDLTSPSKGTEEFVDNTVVVDLTEEDEEDATDEIVSLQECKAEKVETDATAVGDVPAGWSAGEDGGTFTDDTGQRRSARIRQQVVDGQIHLQYRGNPYILSERGALYYDQGQNVADIGATYIDGAVHINVEQLSAEGFCMDDDEIRDHVLGVVMAQQFSLKAGLKNWQEGENSSDKGT